MSSVNGLEAPKNDHSRSWRGLGGLGINGQSGHSTAPIASGIVVPPRYHSSGSRYSRPMRSGQPNFLDCSSKEYRDLLNDLCDSMVGRIRESLEGSIVSPRLSLRFIQSRITDSE